MLLPLFAVGCSAIDFQLDVNVYRRRLISMPSTTYDVALSTSSTVESMTRDVLSEFFFISLLFYLFAVSYIRSYLSRVLI